MPDKTIAQVNAADQSVLIFPTFTKDNIGTSQDTIIFYYNCEIKQYLKIKQNKKKLNKTIGAVATNCH